ncbi:MAG: DUF4357 domain-containing protein [Aeriscardovia sp.]|nr:DUF4357 domain-containing protein [Aeriscardovia sp.]
MEDNQDTFKVSVLPSGLTLVSCPDSQCVVGKISRIQFETMLKGKSDNGEEGILSKQGPYLLAGDAISESMGAAVYAGHTQGMSGKDLYACLKKHVKDKFEIWKEAYFIYREGTDLSAEDSLYIKDEFCNFGLAQPIALDKENPRKEEVSVDDTTVRRILKMLDILNFSAIELAEIPSINGLNLMNKEKKNGLLEHRFHCTTRNADAYGLFSMPDKRHLRFTVLAGSAVSDMAPSATFIDYPYGPLVDRLTGSGTIRDGVFTKDCAFVSPYAAAAVVCMEYEDGESAWSDEDGITLRDIEEGTKTEKSPKESTKKAQQDAQSPETLYIKQSGKTIARGFILPTGRFRVLKGSVAAELQTSEKDIVKQRQAMEKVGIISGGEFLQNADFNSAASATAQVLGVQIPGGDAWENADGVFLKDLKDKNK